MNAVHVTAHAVSRYRERVANVTSEQAREVLSSRTITAAAEFGAPFVRLPSGHRVVIREFDVVTVLPAETHPGTLGGRKC